MNDNSVSNVNISITNVVIILMVCIYIIITFISFLIYPYSETYQNFLSIFGIDSSREILYGFIGGLVFGIPSLIFWIYFHSGPKDSKMNVTFVKKK